MKRTEDEIAAALENSMGNIAMAARTMGYSRSGLNVRINESEKLRQVVADQREAMTDHAESSLNRGVISGEAWAVCFYLKCQGKSRGYTERGEMSHDVRLTVSAAEDLSDEQLADIVRGSSGGIIGTPDSTT